MSKEDKHIKSSYDKGAGSYSEVWKEPHTFTSEYRDHFLPLLPENSLILDVGCGPATTRPGFWIRDSGSLQLMFQTK